MTTWISIHEKLPPRRQRVQVRTLDGDELTAYWGFNDCWTPWTDEDNHKALRATHWRPCR